MTSRVMAPILRGRRWHNDRPPRRRGPLPPEAPAMLRWFESRLDPFPPGPPAQPPASLYAFCRHYTRGAERWLLLLAVSTGLIALAEVSLYAYVGALVDRMGARSEEHTSELQSIMRISYA